MKEYFNTWKRKNFPEMDFTQDQPQYKKRLIKYLTQEEWFWFHPSAYQLMYYGVDSLLILMFIGLSFLFKGILLWINILIIVILLYKLIQKIINYDRIKDTTFYELYLKEV